MHYLNRGAVAAPECLQDYNYPVQTWDTFGGECKKKLRHQLVEMQGIPDVSTAEGAEEFGVRCAYCEGPVLPGGHIEHFRRKNPQHFPQLTFAWENFFLACGARQHCGHYKDRPSADPYLADDLVKPDVHNPEDYFFFSSSGEVCARSGLNPRERHMAEETIRVFNLNHSLLQGMRRKKAQPYVEDLERDLGFLDLEESESARQELESMLVEEFRTRIEETKYDQYAATIWDFYRSKA